MIAGDDHSDINSASVFSLAPLVYGMYTLRFLGSARVDTSAGDADERVVQPRALAVLACLSAAGPDGCTRDKLVGLLWQNLDTHHARHALSVQLHQIRRALGKDALFTENDGVRLNAEAVVADIGQFREAVRTGNLRQAADLYQGPFLDGFHLSGCVEFERWMEDERARLALQCLDLLETLAKRAEREGGPMGALVWWQRAAQHDPFNSRVALACARALAASGDRGNGVQFLREHAARLRVELEIEPDAEILAAIRTGDFGVTPDYSNGTDWPDGHGVSQPVIESREPASPSRSASSAPTLIGDVRPAPREHASDPVRSKDNRPLRRRVVVPVVVTVLALVTTLAVRARNTDVYDPGRIVILPTEVVGLDTTMSELVMSHLRASLADWPSLTPASQSIITELWRTAGGSSRSAPSEAATRSIAARLGAGLMLLSTATPAADGIELHAVLADAADATQIAAARATGSSESLHTLAEQLTVRLLARSQRMPEDRIATLDGYEPDAVRLYLQAHTAGPPERERLLREAVARDSTFALAAMTLLETSPDYYDRHLGDDWDPVAAMLWTHRNRLSPADRAYVEALVGWRFTPGYTAAQHVEAWERAVEVAPDRPRHHRGLALACYRWCSELNAGWAGRWTTRVLEAHDALLDAGDADLGFVERGLEVAVLAGDLDRVRRYADLLPDNADYGRWLAATALGDERDVTELRRLIEDGELNDYRIGNVAVLTGIGLEDAEIIARRDRATGRIHRLRALVQARERGRHAEYRELRDKMFQLEHTSNRWGVFISHQVIWEWAFFDGPETDPVLDAHDGALTEIIARLPRTGPDTLATAYCALAQLRVVRGDTTGLAAAVDFLSRDPDARHLAVARMCAPFLGLLAARQEGHEALARATRRLNDVLRDRPLDLGTGDGMINVEIMLAGAATLELARALLALGYPEAGLRVVVRRPYRAGLWGLFGFHIDFQLEEALLLAAAGAAEQALEKYDLYFRLRPEPPDLGSWRETWEAARAEREALRDADRG
jgi:DNA-binding SARP family transcriptional activator